MKFWSHEETHEIEEELLDRKETIKYLPEKTLARVSWKYEDWECELIEQAAKDGLAVSRLEAFLCRTSGDIKRHVRELGYENWDAYREVMQGVSRGDVKKAKNIDYRVLVESTIGRPLTKEEFIHHVNCDHYDDALENLWICKASNHKHAHASYRKLQKALIGYGVVTFDRDTGDYGFNPDAVDEFMEFWGRDISD